METPYTPQFGYAVFPKGFQATSCGEKTLKPAISTDPVEWKILPQLFVSSGMQLALMLIVGISFHSVALAFDLGHFPTAMFQMVQRAANTLKDKSEN